MATANGSDSVSFDDFPEEIQLCILSFLLPTEIASFACTSKRFVSLCRDDAKFWYAMCDRRWGRKTQIKKWGNGRISFKFLYQTLIKWDNLIGFWLRCGLTNIAVSSPPLIYFEWGADSLSGFRVTPSRNGVDKSQFLLMGISSDGEIANFLDLEGESGDFEKACLDELGNLVRVNVNCVGEGHVLVEENRNSKTVDVIGGSLPEMYMQLANRTWRRQRRKEKERQGKRRWEPEHFLKLLDCSPTPTRPLQGLWKGIISDGTNMDFFLVKYDEAGGIICRRVGDSSSSYYSAPVFWGSTLSFLESPFSLEEACIYDARMRICPITTHDYINDDLRDIQMVSQILHINSSYDLVMPSTAVSVNSQRGEGRIWLYRNGTFGFGFLSNNFVVEMTHIIQDGSLLLSK